MKKAPIILCAAAGMMLCFCVGFFILRNLGSSVIRLSEPQLIRSEISTSEETSAPAFPLLDINAADLEQLMTLPGIGSTYAQRIIEYRQVHGDFTDIQELLNVEGIGQKRLDAISDYITIGGSHENTGR